MNRALVAGSALLVVLFLLARRQPERRRPICHHIYGCTNNLPDWGY